MTVGAVAGLYERHFDEVLGRGQDKLSRRLRYPCRGVSDLAGCRRFVRLALMSGWMWRAVCRATPVHVEPARKLGGGDPVLVPVDVEDQPQGDYRARPIIDCVA